MKENQQYDGREAMKYSDIAPYIAHPYDTVNEST